MIFSLGTCRTLQGMCLLFKCWESSVGWTMSGIVDPMDVFFVASEQSLLLLQMNNGSDAKVDFSYLVASVYL
jgi:hypothetical protein